MYTYVNVCIFLYISYDSAHSVYICVNVCVYVHVYICVSVCMSVCISVCMSVLSLWMLVCMCVCLCICLGLCLSIFSSMFMPMSYGCLNVCAYFRAHFDNSCMKSLRITPMFAYIVHIYEYVCVTFVNSCVLCRTLAV